MMEQIRRNAIKTVGVMIFTVGVQAQGAMTLSEFASEKTIKVEFKKMIRERNLPAWVSEGGVGSLEKTIVTRGTSWRIFSACRPHDCESESVAVMWSEKTKRLAGVFSVIDDKTSQEKLTWINISDELSIDGKTILYAALTGTLDNHPGAFNFK